jgi:hypothetical protein
MYDRERRLTVAPRNLASILEGQRAEVMSDEQATGGWVPASECARRQLHDQLPDNDPKAGMTGCFPRDLPE